MNLCFIPKLLSGIYESSRRYFLRETLRVNGLEPQFKSNAHYQVGAVAIHKGVQFIVMYPPKCAHDLLSLAGTVHTETISIPRGIFQSSWQHIAHIAYSHFSAGWTEAIYLAQGQTKVLRPGIEPATY